MTAEGIAVRTCDGTVSVFAILLFGVFRTSEPSGHCPFGKTIGQMYWIVLIAASIPIYLVIGWTIFDTGDNAKDTFWDALVALLKILLVPDILRALLNMDDDGAYGLLPIGLFFAGCVAITYVEHVLLQKYVF